VTTTICAELKGAASDTARQMPRMVKMMQKRRRKP
jgi:hypothetical protein